MVFCVLLMLISADFPITTAEYSQRYPAVHFFNNQFYVFWVDERFEAVDSTQSLYACRVTPDGTVLDSEGILLFRDEVTEALDVTGDGTNFFVAFRDHC